MSDFSLIQLLAGNSTRFKNKIKKQFIFYQKKPLFLISVLEFLKIKQTSEIIFVINNQDKQLVFKYIDSYFLRLKKNNFLDSNILFYQGKHLFKKKK